MFQLCRVKRTEKTNKWGKSFCFKWRTSPVGMVVFNGFSSGDRTLWLMSSVTYWTRTDLPNDHLPLFVAVALNYNSLLTQSMEATVNDTEEAPVGGQYPFMSTREVNSFNKYKQTQWCLSPFSIYSSPVLAGWRMTRWCVRGLGEAIPVTHIAITNRVKRHARVIYAFLNECLDQDRTRPEAGDRGIFT